MTTVPAVDRWIPPGLQQLLDAHPDQHKVVEAAYWAGVRSGQPYIAVRPSMRSGQPTLNNTRLTVDAVVGMLWAGESVDEVADEYGIDRHTVLVAAWYAGSHGLPGARRKGLAATHWWRERWGVWADQAHDALWATKNRDVDAIPDPPSEQEWKPA